MKTIAPIFAFMALCCATSRAQESRGTIAGRVLDSTGAAVAGAEIRGVNETGAALKTRTNDAASYTLPYLLPGVYDLTAEFTGFKRTGRADVTERVNEVLRASISNWTSGTPTRRWR